MLSSEWYAERLDRRQQQQQSLWQRHVKALDSFLNTNEYHEEKISMDIASRLQYAREQLDIVSATEFQEQLKGSLGTDQI